MIQITQYKSWRNKPIVQNVISNSLLTEWKLVRWRSTGFELMSCKSGSYNSNLEIWQWAVVWVWECVLMLIQCPPISGGRWSQILIHALSATCMLTPTPVGQELTVTLTPVGQELPLVDQLYRHCWGINTRSDTVYCKWNPSFLSVLN